MGTWSAPVSVINTATVSLFMSSNLFIFPLPLFTWRSGSLEKQSRRETCVSLLGRRRSGSWMARDLHTRSPIDGERMENAHVLDAVLILCIYFFSNKPPLTCRENWETSERWPGRVFWNYISRQIIHLKLLHAKCVCVLFYFTLDSLDSCSPFNLNLFLITCFAAKHFGLLIH